ncbi:major facilitator superfamily transporter [Trichoderma arundinaceum]|uniref:Major facilitator superfamily transporter n=1 Tax=Trichoderma arundinaceum TaxID=490622 RepID=A0A395NFH2_TRIAR|nr:major facilitator superfamily transporter [Trichoderma arundinaceum]
MDHEKSTEEGKEEDDVSWAALPQKKQLAVLLYARITESLSQTSFSSYMYYQLAWIDTSLSDTEIALQAGLLNTAFAMGACSTAVFWGRLARSPKFGRRSVVQSALVLALLSCLGMAFANNFLHLFFAQLIGGVASGNVGVIRTTIPELIQDKRFHSRAFSLLPLCTTVGSMTGPLLAGVLVPSLDQYSTSPQRSVHGNWIKSWPFALPMIINSAFVFLAVVFASLGLEERRDLKLRRTKKHFHLFRFVSRIFSLNQGYRPLVEGHPNSHEDITTAPSIALPSLRSGQDDCEEDTERQQITGREETEPPMAVLYESEPSTPVDENKDQSGVLRSAVAWRIIAKLVMSLHFTAYATAAAVFLPSPLETPAVPDESTSERGLGHGLGLGLMMINDYSEDVKVRAKVHSITHSCDSGVAALGLLLGGIILRVGIEIHFVGMAWLLLTLISIANLLLVWKVQQTSNEKPTNVF